MSPPRQPEEHVDAPAPPPSVFNGGIGNTVNVITDPDRVDRLLTATEVADILRCSPKVVGNLFRAGRLHGVRVGRTVRYTNGAVRAFINAGGHTS